MGIIVLFRTRTQVKIIGIIMIGIEIPKGIGDIIAITTNHGIIVVIEVGGEVEVEGNKNNNPRRAKK